MARAAVMHLAAVAAIAAAVCASPACAGLVGIIGGNLVSIDRFTGEWRLIGNPGTLGFLNSLEVDAGGRLITCWSGGFMSWMTWFVQLNPANGEATVLGGHATPQFGGVMSIAFAPDGRLIFNTTNLTLTQQYLWSAPSPEGASQALLIDNQFERLSGMTSSPGGVMYGWSVVSGLGTFDPQTGDWTDISSSKGADGLIQSIAFAPDGTLYGANYDLYTIDLTTGAATLIAANVFDDLRGLAWLPCAGDIVVDDQVNVDDLLAVISNWGPCPIPPAGCAANIANTGSSANQVDADDLLMVITNWGSCER